MVKASCANIYNPITPENRDARLHEIMGSDGAWLGQYLDGKLSLNALNKQQAALAEAIDGVVVGMLNPDIPVNDYIVSFDVANTLKSGEGWITKDEWNKLLDSKHVYRDALLSNSKSIRALEREMGAANAEAFREISGAIAAGFTDENANGNRYHINELKGIASPRTELMLQKISNGVVFFIEKGESFLEAAVKNMEGVCASIETRELDDCDQAIATNLAGLTSKTCSSRNL